MLNRKQILSLLKARRENCFFNKVPIELIREISEFGRDDMEFNKALHHVAFGELEKVKEILNEASNNPDQTKLKELLLLSGTVVTPAGVIVKHTTLLECAIGSGDPEMTEMILPHFSKFAGGEEEKQRQLERYRPCIQGLDNQKPDDLSELLEIIRISDLKDLEAEGFLIVGTGKYDPNYQSPLRDALNKFRREKLSPKVITKPAMHCNYQNLICALLSEDEEKFYDLRQIRLVEQISNFIKFVEMTAYERYIVARRQLWTCYTDEKIERSFQDKRFPEKQYPICERSSLYAHVGIDDLVFRLMAENQLILSSGLTPFKGVQRLFSSKKRRFVELMDGKQESKEEVLPEQKKQKTDKLEQETQEQKPKTESWCVIA